MRYIYIIALLFSVTAHAAAEDARTPETALRDSAYMADYVEAIRQKLTLNTDSAYQLLLRCREARPDAGEVYALMADCHEAEGRDSLARECLRKAAALQPRNTEIAERLAWTYIRQDSVSKAADIYEGISKMHPTRTDFLRMLMQLYRHLRDHRKTLDVINRLELQDGQSDKLTLEKLQEYSDTNDRNGARRELTRLIEANPYDPAPKVLAGNWLYSNGYKAEAKSMYDGVAEEDPGYPDAQAALADYYRMEGMPALADSMMYALLVNPRTDKTLRLSSVKAWINDPGNGADSARVMQLFDRILTLPGDNTEAAVMRASYLMGCGAGSATVRSALRRVLDTAPDNQWARLNLLQQMWQDSIDEAVITECREAIEYIPQEPALHYYLAIALAVNHRDAEAKAALMRGIDAIGKETKPELAADLYGALGDLQQRAKRPSDACRAYEKSLQYAPERTMTLNNYAYCLSLRKEQLDRAAKMSYTAVAAEPNNATYLDTYAWILYQQGHYDDARQYIDMALEAATNDKSEAADTTSMGDMYDHAGDIYFRLGRTDEAVKFWQEAERRGTENPKATKRKLRRGKL